MKDVSLYANCDKTYEQASGQLCCFRTHLLAKADTRAGIEREEDERVWREVLGNALVEEAVRVELVGIGAPEVLAPLHDEDRIVTSERIISQRVREWMIGPTWC